LNARFVIKRIVHAVLEKARNSFTASTTQSGSLIERDAKDLIKIPQFIGRIFVYHALRKRSLLTGALVVR
jgi:hypothetical protein